MDHLVFHEEHLPLREEIVVEHQKWGSRQDFLSRRFEHSIKDIYTSYFLSVIFDDVCVLDTVNLKLNFFGHAKKFFVETMNPP